MPNDPTTIDVAGLRKLRDAAHAAANQLPGTVSTCYIEAAYHYPPAIAEYINAILRAAPALLDELDRLRTIADPAALARSKPPPDL